MSAERAQVIAMNLFASGAKVTGVRKAYLPGVADGLKLCWLIGVERGLDQRKDIFVETRSYVAPWPRPYGAEPI